MLVFLSWRYNDTTTVPVDTANVTTETSEAMEEFVLEDIPLEREVEPQKVKNVIFMVGDGMGLSQITAGYYSNGKSLSLERLKHVGLITTHSATSILTDSAAGATTFSTGRKTRNGMIAMTPDSLPKKTILEYAEAHKLSTGIVVTSTITHATPASFYGHQPKRNSVNEKLVAQLFEKDLEVIIGGGRDYFANRHDGRNMFQEFEGKGYTFIDSIEQAEGKDYNRLICLISPQQPRGITEGRKAGFLTKAAIKGMEILNHNPNGFFLLVEGSQIDWGGHNNDSEYIVEEMLEFNETINAVLDFAEKDGNTLVVITADHETGGYSINDGIMKDSIVRGSFTTDYHTASMVPVFAYGPGAEEFTGIYDNTDIFFKMMAALGFEEEAQPGETADTHPKAERRTKVSTAPATSTKRKQP